jgi:cytochrome c biogenesis protein CcdA/thiol-disulfide isomerase/thioredoxin
MLLYVLAFIGGMLTIVSPCILPVLPFVFSRADQPFRRSGLPLLAGMAVTFAALGAVATLAGAWIVRANQAGRIVAIVIFSVLGLTLLFPRLAELLARPFVRFGARVEGSAGKANPVDAQGTGAPSVGRSFILGVSTGFLWAPCAGPILGLILTGAAIQGPSAHTAILLLVFALGAACSLGLALFAGNKVFAFMKRSLGAEEWIRRGLGVAVLLGAVAIASGWDTGILQRISLASTSGIEQRLIDRVHPASVGAPTSGAMTSAVADDAPIAMTSAAGQTPGGPSGQASMKAAGESSGASAMMQASAKPTMQAAVKAQVQAAHIDLKTEGAFPSLDGAVAWLNSPPLTRDQLKGKVVLIDFWTYSCINCLRAIPYVEAWAEKYKNDGLVVIGVHTPEFAFEKDQGNVAKAVRDLKITYPVAIDSNYAIWKAFSNQYWPAHYFIDRQGNIVYHHFGEGEYDKSEQVIQQLLQEGNSGLKVGGTVTVNGKGAQAAPDMSDVQSPETYVGYSRQQNYASPEPIEEDTPWLYTAPGRLNVNQWGLGGSWNVGDETAILAAAPGKIIFRFHARDLHLVLGPGKDGKPIRFRVLLDDAAPGDDAGADVNGQGNGTVKEYRLYQLIRQKGKVEDRTFQIEFLDPGVQAFAFTFG